MKRRLGLAVLALAALAVALVLPSHRRLRACGPMWPEAHFTHATHPDFPLEGFAGGELGVLEPAYARSYLCVAYRVLEGPPLAQNLKKGGLRRRAGRQSVAHPQGPVAFAVCPAIALRRAMRSSVEGWLANKPDNPPCSGLTMNICAVAGLASASGLPVVCAT